MKSEYKLLLKRINDLEDHLKVIYTWMGNLPLNTIKIIEENKDVT